LLIVEEIEHIYLILVVFNNFHMLKPI